MEILWFGRCIKNTIYKFLGKFKSWNYRRGYFWGCSNLNLSNVSDVLDLTGTTNLYYAFYKCTSLTTINRVNEWDTSRVTIMQNLFASTNFNQNIGAWNVSKVINFRLMFNPVFNNGEVLI